MTIPISEFINNIDFDYIETYSFQRGKEFEENQKAWKQELDILKVRKYKRNNLTHEENVRFAELVENYENNHYLINSNGKFHYSSSKISSIDYSDERVATLKSILNKAVVEQHHFMCGPIFRDAIVFFKNKKQIVGTLNICFYCSKMVVNNHRLEIEADNSTFNELYHFLSEIGHNIE